MTQYSIVVGLSPPVHLVLESSPTATISSLKDKVSERLAGTHDGRHAFRVASMSLNSSDDSILCPDSTLSSVISDPCNESLVAMVDEEPSEAQFSVRTALWPPESSSR